MPGPAGLAPVTLSLPKIDISGNRSYLAVSATGAALAIPQYKGPGGAVCKNAVTEATSARGITLKLSSPKNAGRNRPRATARASGMLSAPGLSRALLPGLAAVGASAVAANAALHGRENR